MMKIMNDKLKGLSIVMLALVMLSAINITDNVLEGRWKVVKMTRITCANTEYNGVMNYSCPHSSSFPPEGVGQV